MRGWGRMTGRSIMRTWPGRRLGVSPATVSEMVTRLGSDHAEVVVSRADIDRIFDMLSSTVRRMGYGAMQLTGRGVVGPPEDRTQAIAVLRAASVDGGVAP